MKGLRPVPLVLLGTIAATPILAQDRAPRESDANWIRWTGGADWEYYSSAGDSQGVESTFRSLRQKYSLGLDGSLWDPRFNRFNLGFDFFRTDRETEAVAIDSESFGYRVQSLFFPARPFPLRLYARRADLDVAGSSLADRDRQTAAWGAEWNLGGRRWEKLRLLFNRSSFDLTAPLTLLERQKTGLVDFATRAGRSDLSFGYNLHGQEERLRGTDFNRHQFTFTDRTRFRNGSFWMLNSHYTRSDALFSSGQRDELNTSRVSTRYELPQPRGIRLGFGYDFNENDGMFLDSTSHIGRADGTFPLPRGWQTGVTLTAGRIESNTPSMDIEETLAGIQTGLQYGHEWNRAHLRTGYSIGYDQARFDNAPDREFLSHNADVSIGIPLNGSEEFFASLSYSLDDNDTTGLAFTRSKIRADAGLEGSARGFGRFRASAAYTRSNYDTFQFGIQESEEFSLNGSLAYQDGGVSLTLSTAEGTSDFLPDPTASSPFLPGTDLVSRADVAAASGHWRILKNLRFRMQARLENRDFTTIGRENILSYHPRIEYDFHTWQFSAGYSHYERRNGTEFTDDTLMLKISKRFF